MLMAIKSTTELVQIAAAGGGLRFPASVKSTTELVQIASTAAGRGSRIVLTDAGAKSTMELVQIASAGKGCVLFEFE
jgi:hypothetical protein